MEKGVSKAGGVGLDLDLRTKGIKEPRISE
jgi:hypothetical protein